ncbi:hypothetical protein QE152_g19277 [Popillia japonica]|uniref:Uncharacterized protein n=1 Tax=Popillia japonica TaxID=7064 RepID=A0AAW1KPM4_POPJA
MTGDPNQSNRPSVLGLNCSYSSPDDWNTFVQPLACGPRNDMCQFSQPGLSSANNYLFYSNFGPLPSPISFPMTVSPENGTMHRSIALRCKRKTDTPIPVPAKQQITEERMAEHLSKLHISSENPAPTTEPETSDCKERRLYMCEEMRKLQTDSVIPQSLLERMNSPCKALVLWTPPRRPFPLVDRDNDENDNNNNNNEDEVPDNNLMDLDR